jgi:hypothetical protein
MWRLYSKPRLMALGMTRRVLVTRLLLFLLMTTKHPSLSIEVLTSDLKNTFTPLMSLLRLGLWPARRSSLTLLRSLSLPCRKSMASLFSRGSLVFPARMSCRTPPCCTCPMMAPMGRDTDRLMLATVILVHSEINEWILQLFGLEHAAGFLLVKSSGQFLNIFPLR